METNPAGSEDSPPFQAILDALEDPDCRRILRETAEPMTATQLVEAVDVPRSTLYRKLDLLSGASLLREEVTVNPEGGRTTRYQRDFDDVTISIDEDDQFEVNVERPSRSAGTHLANIWSKMGDEL